MKLDSHGNSHMERIQISVEEFQEGSFQGSTQDPSSYISFNILVCMWNAFQISSCSTVFSFSMFFFGGFFIAPSSMRGDCLDSQEGKNDFKLKNSQTLTGFLVMWDVCGARWHCLRNGWNSISKWAYKCEPSAERDTNLQCLYSKQELMHTAALKALGCCCRMFTVQQNEKFPPVFTLCRDPYGISFRL